MAKPISPATFNLPVINAIWGFNDPESKSARLSVEIVTVQLALPVDPSTTLPVGPVKSKDQMPPPSPVKLNS